MSDQNKQQNSLQQAGIIQSSSAIQGYSFLKDNPQSAYLYKKTEKLVSAIYLLSNFISDKEPLKWQLREAGLELISASLEPGKIITLILRLLSLLEVARISGIISEMNFSILKYEFDLLIKTVESGEASGAHGLAFPDQFFAVENTPAPAASHDFSKGHQVLSDRLSIRNTQDSIRTSEVKHQDKSNRQEVIISLLRKNGELGIKDFTSSIRDCSEKTIQRELASLVSKGQVKKVGEKRWSRYSIK
jgi:hypothetical protein